MPAVSWIDDSSVQTFSCSSVFALSCRSFSFVAVVDCFGCLLRLRSLFLFVLFLSRIQVFLPFADLVLRGRDLGGEGPWRTLGGFLGRFSHVCVVKFSMGGGGGGGFVAEPGERGLEPELGDARVLFRCVKERTPSRVDARFPPVLICCAWRALPPHLAFVLVCPGCFPVAAVHSRLRACFFLV